MLIQPFPAIETRLAAPAVDRILAGPERISPDVFSVSLNGEPLAIPERIYIGEADLRLAGNAAAQPFIDCLLTRHHDGFVRSRALGRIIGAVELWTTPFVTRLIGEYVVEILDQISAGLGDREWSLMGTFAKENPAFFDLTKSRVISYWDCYYRRHADWSDYVGNQLIRRLAVAASGGGL
jgi:hypothetical protein